MAKSPWTGLGCVVAAAIFKIWAIRAIARYGLKQMNKQ